MTHTWPSGPEQTLISPGGTRRPRPLGNVTVMACSSTGARLQSDTRPPSPCPKVSSCVAALLALAGNPLQQDISAMILTGRRCEEVLRRGTPRYFSSPPSVAA